MTSHSAFAHGLRAPRITTGSGRQHLSRTAIAVLTIGLLIANLLGASPASAAICAPTDLIPQVRGYSINQGLSSFANLIRGKDIVFRLFLSRPACANGTTQSVSLTGATLNVKAGAATLLSIPAPTNSLIPPPLLAHHSDAPAVPDSTGDPKWLVSGSALAAATPPAATPLTFEATLRYSNSAGGSGTTLPITTFANNLIAKTLLPSTTPLRVLAIPLGDGAKTVASQFSAKAKTATLDGFSVLGRIFPVANGAADLTTILATETAGMRYHLNTNTQINVKPHMNASGIFCDNGSALETRIAPQMETNLNQYNTANPGSKSADHVLGVIDQAISGGCTQGYALVNSAFSYVRARYKTSDTDTTNPVMTGALMGMELTHNFGAVPCAGSPECSADRDNGSDAGHSQNTWAHSSAAADYPDVAYNLQSPTAVGQPVADRNVMQFAAQDPGTWLNSNTFLQKEDWALLTCKLGGPSTPDCNLPVDGSAAAIGAQPTTTIVGTTDGTKAGTEVFDSFAEVNGPTDQPRPSFIHLVQRNVAGGVEQDNPVRLTDDGGDGHHGSSAESHSSIKVFSASFATDPDAVKLQLVNVTSGEVLYERVKTGGGPRNVHTTVAMTGGTPGGCTSDCPPPSEMTSAAQFGTGAETIDFEKDPQTGQPYSPGTTVSTQYLASEGVSFNDDPTTTPKIIGSCPDNPCRFPPGTGTQSGRFGLWNSPDTLPVGPVDPVPDSRGIPLTVNFVQPIQRVGLYMGNDDVNNTTATLTAFNGTESIKTVSKSAFGAASTTFIGIDAGQANITSIRLDYGQSPLGEEIDDLIFERPPGGTVTNTYRATVTAEDDEPNNMRAAFFAKCPASNEILIGGVKPDSVEGERATFHHDFDATQVCRNGSTTTILVRFNDGYNQTALFPIDVNAVSSDPPVAVIDTPAADAQAYSVLQHEPITLNGQGWDAQEGVLPGSALTWTVTGPNGVISSGQHGNTLTLTPPAGGSWVPGAYTAQLTVQNSAGLTTSTTAPFTVLEDKDNDGIPVTTEGCYKGNDNDPNDAFGDFDKDGVVNQQDEDPCTPRATYEGQAEFDPNTLNYPSQGGGTSVTMKVRLRYRDVSQVSGSTVRISRVGGHAIPASDTAFKSTGWTVTTSQGVKVATAKFDRQAIINKLCPSPEACQTNQTIWITLTGDAPAGPGKPAYSFHATATFNVQKS